MVFGVQPGDSSPQCFKWENEFKGFFCDEEPDITVVSHYCGLEHISLPPGAKVFESSSFWEVYMMNGRTIFVLARSPDILSRYCIAVWDADSRRVDIHYSVSERTPASHPLRYPVFHLVLSSLLAAKSGCLVHACGIAHKGRGFLFTGSSGRGKTTMARLWDGMGTVLSDERTALRERDGRLWVYGTPWYGDLGASVNMGVPLDGIFFLEGRDLNHVRQMKPAMAAARLLSHCLLPVWDEAGMKCILDFCNRFATSLPCRELAFVDDKTVVDFILCMNQSSTTANSGTC